MAPRTKVEKRLNTEDGKKYSEDEFKEYYGAKAGAKWWKAAAPAAAAAAPSGKACTCCGNTNHSKADCKFKDKECSSCGKTGHLAKVCRSSGAATTTKAASGKACTVCGKDNHVKADCKLKDKECSNCGKVGHIAKVCRQGEKAAGTAKPKAKAKAKKEREPREPRVLATEGEIPITRVARVYRGKVKDEAGALALDGLVNELRAKLVANRKEKTKGFLKIKRQVCKTEWAYELTVVWRSFDDFTAYKTSDFRKEVNGEFEEKAKVHIVGDMYSGVRVYDEV